LSDNSTIVGCYSTGNILGNFNSGGIAGGVYRGGTIIGCYSTGSVSSSGSSSRSGGIAGYEYDNNCMIISCYSVGNVSSSGSSSEAGGIAGGVSNGTITGCYSVGNVSSSGSYSFSGGIAGYIIYSSSSITNCAAINITINSTYYTGRIVGYNSGNYTPTIANNFALTDMKATGAAFNTTAINHGIDKTDVQLQTKETYSGAVDPSGLGNGGLGWKFDGNNDDAPWKMPAGGGYPILYWQ